MLAPLCVGAGPLWHTYVCCQSDSTTEPRDIRLICYVFIYTSTYMYFKLSLVLTSCNFSFRVNLKSCCHTGSSNMKPSSTNTSTASSASSLIVDGEAQTLPSASSSSPSHDFVPAERRSASPSHSDSLMEDDVDTDILKVSILK